MTISRTHPGWFSRNWKWFVPVILVAALGVLLLFLTLIFALVFGILKKSEPYEHALASAGGHPAVIEAIGEPVEAGLLVMGQLKYRGQEGRANLRFTVHGPGGKGSIQVLAERSLGQWIYRRMVVVLETGDMVDLLAP